MFAIGFVRRVVFFTIIVALCLQGVSAGAIARSTRTQAAAHASILYAFTGANDGETPEGTLVADGSGALYGTTLFGGAYDEGTVFKLTPGASGYTERVLHAFAGGSDGAHPMSGLTLGGDGALYGTTEAGGGAAACTGSFAGCGTVFKLTPAASGYVETIVHAFAGSPDGADPESGVIVGEGQVLFGTTAAGGGFGNSGLGTVYKLVPGPSGYVVTILHMFTDAKAGWWPLGELVEDAHGNLYGTTNEGGPHNHCGCGSIFKLTRAKSEYTFDTLRNFAGKQPGGIRPDAGLTLGPDGVLYGANTSGGSAGFGTVFSIASSGRRFHASYAFQGGAQGDAPSGGVVFGADGRMFGATTFFHGGTVYSLTPTPSGYRHDVLYTFDPKTEGIEPHRLLHRNGVLFGALQTGGKYGHGAVFALVP